MSSKYKSKYGQYLDRKTRTNTSNPTAGNTRSPFREGSVESQNSTTVTPTSSQDEGQDVPGAFHATAGKKATSAATNSMNDNNNTNNGGGVRGSTNTNSSLRFSTKSKDARKPWLGGPKPAEDPNSSSANPSTAAPPAAGNVLYTPPSHNRPYHVDHNLDQNGIKQSTHGGTGTTPQTNFDDLWDESCRSTGDDPVNLIITTTNTTDSGGSAVTHSSSEHHSTPPPAAVEIDTSKFVGGGTQRKTSEVDTSRFTKKSNASSSNIEVSDLEDSHKKLDIPEVDTSRFASKKAATGTKEESTGAVVDTSKFNRSSSKMDAATGADIDTSKFSPKGSVVDTSKFHKGARAPPNTPDDPLHYSSRQQQQNPPVSNPASPDTPDAEERKEHPIKHPRKKTSSSRGGSRDGSKRSHKSRGGKKGSGKDGDDDKPKKKTEYTDKDEAIASLEKQLDRVTFLQKRQFDQLSSLKKMLLGSRDKEKESAMASKEWKEKAEEREAEIVKLLNQSESAMSGAGTSAAVVAEYSVNREAQKQLKEKDDRIAALQKQLKDEQSKGQSAAASISNSNNKQIEKDLKEKDVRIAALEEQLEEMKRKQNESESQRGDALATAESKLRKKMKEAEQFHEELEELRQQLTTANSTIEQLEQEGNYSRAKMSELNDMMNSKGGLSNTENELIDRAAEISNLSSKLSTMDAKVQDRDNKIFKLQEEIKGINRMVLQLSEAFVGEDKELKMHQDLLIESATTPSQTSNLLLMTMMNMLDSLKTKLAALQKDRDDINAKAADRGIQLAESHIRVDKLRTELRRMRAEREQAKARPSSTGPPPNANPNGTAQAAPAHARHRHASHNPSNGAPPVRQEQAPVWKGFTGSQQQNGGANGNQQAQQSPPNVSDASPPRNRFMNFIKGNLMQEHEGTPEQKNNGGRPMVVST